MESIWTQFTYKYKREVKCLIINWIDYTGSIFKRSYGRVWLLNRRVHIPNSFIIALNDMTELTYPLKRLL